MNLHYLDISNITYTEFCQYAEKNQHAFQQKKCQQIEFHELKEKLSIKTITNVTKMTIFEELAALLMLAFGVPGAAFSIPIILSIIGFFTNSFLRAYLIGFLLLLPLAFTPVKFSTNALTSWISFQIIRYFSYKFIFEEYLPEGKPRILVAPPHGVWPQGNLLTLCGYPTIFGYSFRGLASSAVFVTPIFRQILTAIGCIDASRSSAAKALNSNLTVGISTGGVAEVFEANNKDEIIILKNRKGLVKLALTTGAELVPCYLFGNTRIYSLFTGGKIGHAFFRKLSRKIGFATIIFWGRFFLPIPYRKPIFGVMGKPIPVVKTENPSDEQINELHELLLKRMEDLFDTYKDLYGWSDKKLIIE